MKRKNTVCIPNFQFRPYFLNPFRIQGLIGMATVALAFPYNLSAADYLWDVNDSAAGLGGTGTWDTTNAFWDLLATGADLGTDATTAYTFTNADTAIFAGTAGTVTLGTGVTVNGLRIDTAGYVITGNTLTLAGSTPTITANANASISSVLAGTAGLVKAGSGTIAIGTQATYTGGTTINTNGGMLDLTGGGGVSGTIRGAITVNTGGTLRLSTGDATGYATDSTRLSQINLVGGTLDVNTSSNQTLGSAVINMTGGSMTGVTNSNLDFFAGSSALNTLASSTTSTISGLKLSIRQTGGLTITVADGAAASDLSISSAIAGNSGFAAAPLIKAGAGNLTLSGANTYTGATIVSAGTLTLSRTAGFGGTSGSISTGALTVNSGATATTAVVFGISGDNSATNARVVNVNGMLNLAASEYIKTYNLTGGTINAPTAANEFLRASSAGLFINSLASAATSTINNKIDLTFASATIDTANGTAPSDLTITGVISENSGAGSGAKSITKSGAGTLTLSGVNTFTGDTTVTGGTLAIGGAGRLASGTYTGAVAISSGAVFSVESSAAQVLSGVISGQGSLIKGGTGLLTLSGTAINTFTGGTTVNRGTLLLDNANLATPTDLLNSSNVLTLGGGALTVKGKTGAFATSQTVAGTTLNPGASTARVELNTGTSTTLNLGAITRNQGATLNVTADSGLTNTASATLVVKTTGITYNGSAVALPGPGLKKYVGAGFFANSGTSTSHAQIDEFGQFVAPPTATGWISTGGDANTVYNATTAGAAAAQAALTGDTTAYAVLFNAATSYTQSLGTSKLATNGMLSIAAGTVTLSGTGAAGLVIGAEKDLVINTGSTGGMTISAPITESVAGSSLTYTAQSSGVLTLNGTVANSYTGGTSINNGTLSIGTGGTVTNTSHVGALGSGVVKINPGGTLRLWIRNDATHTYANNLELHNGRILGEDGVNIIDGTVLLTGANTFTTNWGGKNLDFTKVISGTGSVTMNGGDGTKILRGNNSFSGGTTLSGATVQALHANAFGSGAVTVAGNSTLTVSTALAKDITVNSGVTLTVNGGFVNYTGAISGAGNVTANNSIHLFGTNTYTGKTTVTGGFLTINAESGLGATPGTITADSLTLSGGGFLSNYLAPGTVTLGANRGVTVAAGNTGGFDAANGRAMVVSGIVTGSGNINKTGTGTLTLTGINDYTGNTNINNGTLDVSGASGALGGTTAVSINGGSLLLSGAASNRVNNSATVSLGGNNTPASKLELGNAAVTETMGALSLTAGTSVRVIDFGDTAFAQNGKLTFASLTGASATPLQIWNWSGSLTGNGGDQLIIASGALAGGLALTDISFYNGGSGSTFLGTAAFSSGNNLELVPVPEPGALTASVLVVGFAFAGSRRRTAKNRPVSGCQTRNYPGGEPHRLWC